MCSRVANAIIICFGLFTTAVPEVTSRSHISLFNAIRAPDALTRGQRFRRRLRTAPSHADRCYGALGGLAGPRNSAARPARHGKNAHLRRQLRTACKPPYLALTFVRASTVDSISFRLLSAAARPHAQQGRIEPVMMGGLWSTGGH